MTEGREPGRRLSVDADLLIGREAPEDDGRLGDDPEISRRHARLSREADGQLTIEDLGSANGTFVNDERIDAPADARAPATSSGWAATVLQVTDRSGAVPPSDAPPADAPADEPPSVRAEAGRGARGHRRDGPGPPAHRGRRARPRARGRAETGG